MWFFFIVLGDSLQYCYAVRVSQSLRLSWFIRAFVLRVSPSLVKRYLFHRQAPCVLLFSVFQQYTFWVFDKAPTSFRK